MAARGKTMALSIAGVGGLVLLAGAVVLREPILEEWHIHKLRTGDPEEARRAAEALGKMGSVRAVPAILEAPGRIRRESGGAREYRGRPTLRPLREILGSDAGFEPTVPFRIVGHPEWEIALDAFLLETSHPPALVMSDAGGLVIRIRGEAASFQAFRWASDALARIGDRGLPALERSAADETLHAGARAFSSFELARRALAHPRIFLQDGSAQVNIEQRTSVPLPGSRGSVYLSAGDITRGRVKIWITPSTGAPLIEGHSLAEGEEVSFSLAGKSYVLRLEDLRNRLIGTDHAVFRIRENGK